MKLIENRFFGFSTAATLLVALSAGAEPWYGIIEAEDLQVKSGWQVARGREGYFPAYPNQWSGNRLKADSRDAEAVAGQEVAIPADGRYAVWVRYESSYGFDSLFRVELRQKGKTVFASLFGDRSDVKYFNGNWRVQEAWDYHNTDYVYQKGVAELSAGPAKLVLAKGANGKYGAARIVDLICLTSDLAMEPGAEMMAWLENAKQIAQPPIQSRCVKPVYFRLRVPRSAPAPTQARMNYAFWETVGGTGFGPHRDFAFTRTDLRQRWPWEKAAKREEDENLPAGFDSGWRRLDLSAFGPAWLKVTVSGAVELAISHDAEGKDAATFPIEGGLTREIFVATGNSRLEDDVVKGKPAIFFADLLRRYVEELDAYKAPGKRAFTFGLLECIYPLTFDGYDKREFARALGVSGQYMQTTPQVCGPEAERFGFNRRMGYRSLQNAHLNRACYEGDYSAVEKTYAKEAGYLKTNGLWDIPQNTKMIEETGPPSLKTLAGWPKIGARFRDHLQQQGIKPEEVLDRKALATALASGKTNAADLWPQVTLGAGTPAEAENNPILFYHTKVFGSILFADNCANATKLVEKYFAPGSVANSGAFMPQDGHGERRNYYDEFMLFRRRGLTAFGSEMTWGLCGMAYYIGAQSESYEGTIARGVAKYHAALLGPSHVLASGIYGYNADFVEMAAYAQVSHGFSSLAFYDSTQYLMYNVYPEIRQAIKRVSWTLGAVEDALMESKSAPAAVALGWSETTAIWDQAAPPDPGYNRPGNVMYPLERHYLYLLLRHLQLPADLLCDADLEDGRLKDYQVYFLVGDHLTGKAAEALRRWVEAGGVLISVAGGGLWDEYNRPLDTLKDVYGIKSARQYAKEQGKEYIPGEVYPANPNDNRLVKDARALRAKLELIHAYPLDEIKLAGYEAKLPALGYRQGFKTEGGKVLGTFLNGETAVVGNTYGQGQALILGFLPGIGYLYQAFPMIPYGRGGEDLSMDLYPDYKPLVRDGLRHLLSQVRPELGAAVTCSNPYVEANLLRQKNGTYHAALVNYTGKPLPELEVRIKTQAVGNARAVKAAFAKARTKGAGGELLVKLALDKFEWLTFE